MPKNYTNRFNESERLKDVMSRPTHYWTLRDFGYRGAEDGPQLLVDVINKSIYDNSKDTDYDE